MEGHAVSTKPTQGAAARTTQARACSTRTLHFESKASPSPARCDRCASRLYERLRCFAKPRREAGPACLCRKEKRRRAPGAGGGGARPTLRATSKGDDDPISPRAARVAARLGADRLRHAGRGRHGGARAADPDRPRLHRRDRRRRSDHRDRARPARRRRQAGDAERSGARGADRPPARLEGRGRRGRARARRPWSTPTTSGCCAPSSTPPSTSCVVRAGRPQGLRRAGPAPRRRAVRRSSCTCRSSAATARAPPTSIGPGTTSSPASSRARRSSSPASAW